MRGLFFKCLHRSDPSGKTNIFFAPNLYKLRKQSTGQGQDSGFGLHNAKGKMQKLQNKDIHPIPAGRIADGPSLAFGLPALWRCCRDHCPDLPVFHIDCRRIH
jgi:hypothetical protein